MSLDTLETLFPMPTDTYRATSDDCYTPRWVFDAMQLRFDLDVAAPPGGPWHVPADRYYTAEDDGLTSPWEGVVWCNPPYSDFTPWAEKWAAHPTGVLMGLMVNRLPARELVFRHADAVTFINPKFERPGQKPLDLWQAIFVAFRGVGTEAAERLSAADKWGGVLYGPNSPA